MTTHSPAGSRTLQATFHHTPVRRAAVSLVAAIPAAGAAYAAGEALATFAAMTRYQGAFGNGHGGLATIAAVFAHVNASVLAAVVLGLALTVYLRFMRQRSPDPASAIPANRLAIVLACLGGVPAAVVYLAEDGVLRAFAAAGATSVTAASEQMTTLFSVAVGLGIAIALLGVLAAAWGWRTGRLAASTATPWMLAGAALLFVALAFAARSFALQDAIAGHV